MQIELNGITRDISIEYRRNKNMYLRVKEDGSLYVTCPRYCTHRDILSFIQERAKWIEKQTVNNERRRTEVLTGKDHQEAVWRGKHYQVQVILSKQNFMFFDEEKNLITFYLKEDTPEMIEKTFYKEGSKYLSLLIQERRSEWDTVICKDHNRPLPQITVKYMTSRWGSCIPSKGKINISMRLIHFPDVCLDYVLLHEYTHLLVPNHQKEFYDIVETYMPQYKQYNQMLR